MQSEENKNTWISLFIIVGCVILLLVFSIFQLSPLIKATMQDWSTIQNSSSITQNDKDKLNASLDTLRTIGIVAGPISTVAGAFVLFLNFTVGNRTAEIANRNAEIADRNAEIANRNVEITESRLITERFSKAIEQLGSDTLIVCLGGIYSLEKIATEANSTIYYYEIIIEILTALIRETPKFSTEDRENAIKSFSTLQRILNCVERLNSRQTSSEKLLDLKNANLFKCKFEGNFSSIDFQEATLDKALIHKAKFINSCFSVTSLMNTNIQESNFENANFQKANFMFAKLTQSYFENANFENASFVSAKLIQSHFENANFENANFQRARSTSTELRQSYFQNANFQNANLIDADLSQSDFQSANFQGADLSGADLSQSNFKNAFFTNVEQIKAANNYKKAIYDDDLRQQLNIPDA